MKKLLIAGLLFIPMIAMAEEDFGVNVPQWSDFSPRAFVDVKQPKGLSKLNPTYQYWYERKVQFEESLEDCKAKEASDERFSCYEALKVSQYRMNNDYNAKLEAKNNSQSSIPGMQNRTDNMLPIGGYLENMTRYMPSEVR